VRAVVVVLCGACSFRHGVLPDATGVDVQPFPDGPITLHVAHVPDAVTATFDATATLAITNATLDTGSGATQPMLSVTLPAGAMLLHSAQAGGGPELAILEVGSMTVTGTLSVTGGRPLVVIARSTIVVAGAIDGSARKATPGAGGSGPGAGAGSGGGGIDDGPSFDDSGGGGGGFGETGAAGQGSGPCGGGALGPAYGTPELATLEGGSGGGAVSPACSTQPAGAGGGAIQLFAGESITVDGAVRASGGGGAAGIV
jgi:hypothetical protein